MFACCPLADSARNNLTVNSNFPAAKQLFYHCVADLCQNCSGSRSTSVAERPGGTCREPGVDPGQRAEFKKYDAYPGVTLRALQNVHVLRQNGGRPDRLSYSSSPPQSLLCLPLAPAAAAAVEGLLKTHYVTPGSQGITQPSTDGAH